jgi:sporulation protein YlmC with PRC-barrel domain
MLRTVKDLQGYAIRATDGVVGEVADFLFDDEDWVIRYLVVDAGTWLAGRHVLISPVAIGHPDWMAQLLPVSITREQVRNSPDIDTRKPVSRQHEAQYLNYYGYSSYWGGTGLWGMGGYPGGLTTTDEDVVRAEMKARRRTKAETGAADDSHLRSCKAIIGHHIHATDGEIGHVENVLVDEHTWAIRYFVVDTSNWWGGHHVLVAPQWIQGVSWAESTVSVDVTREAVKGAPRYDSAAQLDRQQEAAIYEHYGRPGYWTTKAIRDSAADRG